ncbi:MAG: hypothetical protein LKJ88_02530 [Bacilli bacterium]|jgi:hypothetical protein|nr:hypothetical protein [Bacilli bacterium]
MAEENTQEKRTAKDTLLFLGKSLFKNSPILEEEEKGWLAMLFIVLSIILSVAGVLISGLKSNADGIISTSSETAIDKGLEGFAYDINENTDTIKIVDGSLASTGKFAMKTVTEANSTTDLGDPNTFYTHDNNGTMLTVFRTYFLDLDPIKKSSDSTLLTNFITYSIFKVGGSASSSSATSSTSSTSSSVSSTAHTWTPSSFIIFTKSTVHISTYKPVGAKSTDSAVTSISGSLAGITLDLYTLGHDEAGNELTDTTISTNTLKFLNKAYDTVKVTSAWSSTGIYAAMSTGVIVLAGLIFWLITRSKSSVKHYSFWQSLKIVGFMSFTPAIITFIVSFFMASYAPFIFLMTVSLRIMYAVQKLGGSNQANDNQPVYKARS